MGIFDLSKLSNKNVAESEVKETSKEVTGLDRGDFQNNTDTTNVVDNKDQDNKEAITIELNGPLSQIYTKALNLVYANENNIEFNVIHKGDKKSNPSKSIYIYCCKADEITNTDLMDVSNDLRIALDSNYKKVIIAAEYSKELSNKIGTLERIASESGVQIYFKRNNALNAVKTALESLK